MKKTNKKRLKLGPKLAIAFGTIAVLGASSVGFMKLYAKEKAIGRVEIRVSRQQSKIEQRRVLEAVLLNQFYQPVAKYAYNVITNNYDFNPEGNSEFDPNKDWVKKGDDTPVQLMVDLGKYKKGDVIKYGEFFDLFINNNDFNLPRLELKTGPILFVNEYIPALSPDEFIEYTNWFLQNVSWGPDLVTLTKFSLTPGVETQGNAIILGSHSGTREKTQIKFSPDAFFGSMPIFSALAGPGQDSDKLTYKLNSKNLSTEELTKYLKNLPYLISAYNRPNFHGVVNYEAIANAKDLYVFNAANYLVDPFTKSFNNNSYTYVLKEMLRTVGGEITADQSTHYNLKDLWTDSSALANILETYNNLNQSTNVDKTFSFDNELLANLTTSELTNFLATLESQQAVLNNEMATNEEDSSDLQTRKTNVQNLINFISLLKDLWTFNDQLINKTFAYPLSLTQLSSLRTKVNALNLGDLTTTDDNLVGLVDLYNSDRAGFKNSLVDFVKYFAEYLTSFATNARETLKTVLAPFSNNDDTIVPTVDFNLFLKQLFASLNLPDDKQDLWYSTSLASPEQPVNNQDQLSLAKANLEYVADKFKTVFDFIRANVPYIEDNTSTLNMFNKTLLDVVEQQAAKTQDAMNAFSFNYLFSAKDEAEALTIASNYLYEIFNKYGYNVKLNSDKTAKNKFATVNQKDVNAVKVKSVETKEFGNYGAGFSLTYDNNETGFVLLPFNLNENNERDETLFLDDSSTNNLTRSFLSRRDSIFYNSLNDLIIKNFDDYLKTEDVHNFRNLYNYDAIIKDKEVFVYDDNNQTNPRFYDTFDNLLLNETKNFDETKITRVQIESASFGEASSTISKANRLVLKTKVLKSYDPAVILDPLNPLVKEYTLLAKTENNPKGRLYDSSFDDAFNTFKVAIKYFDPFTPRVIKEQSQFVDNEMRKSYEVYVDVFSGLIDKVVNKRPYLMKKINGVHQEVVYDDNGAAHYEVVDGEYYGFFATDRVPYLSIVAETDPSFKTTGINYLKYVGAHEYGHHQTLQYVKDISDTRDISEVGGITSRSGLGLDSLYNINIVQDYLNARSSGIGVRRMKIDYTPSDEGELTNFSTNAVLDDDRSKYIWESPTDVWGADAPDKANNFYKNKKRRFLQTYEQLDEAAKLRGVKISDLFLLNAFDHNSGTLSPSIDASVISPELVAKDLLAARYFLTREFKVDPQQVSAQYRSENPEATTVDVEMYVASVYEKTLTDLRTYVQTQYDRLNANTKVVANNNNRFNPLQVSDALVKKVNKFVSEKDTKTQKEYDALFTEANNVLIDLTSFEIPSRTTDFSNYAGILKDGMGNNILFADGRPVVYRFKDETLTGEALWNKHNIDVLIKTKDNNDVLNLTSFSNENDVVDQTRFTAEVNKIVNQINALLLVPGSSEAPRYSINGWESDGKAYSDEPISSSWAFTQRKEYVDAYEAEKWFNIGDPMVQTFGQNVASSSSLLASLTNVIDRSSAVSTVISSVFPFRNYLQTELQRPNLTAKERKHYQGLLNVVLAWINRIVVNDALGQAFRFQPSNHPFLRGMRFAHADGSVSQYFGRAIATVGTGVSSAVVSKTSIAFSDAFKLEFNQQQTITNESFVDNNTKYFVLGSMVSKDNDLPLFFLKRAADGNQANDRIVANVNRDRYGFLYDFPAFIVNQDGNKEPKYNFQQLTYKNQKIDTIEFKTLEEAVAFFAIDFTKYHYNKATQNAEFSFSDEYAYIDNTFFDTDAYYEANKVDIQTGGLRTKASVISDLMRSFKLNNRDFELFIKSDNIPLSDLSKYKHIFEGRVGLDGVASFGNSYSPNNLTAQPASQIAGYAMRNKNNVFEVDPNAENQRSVDDIIGLVKKYMVDVTKQDEADIQINYGLLVDITLGYSYIYPTKDTTISTYAELFAYNVSNTQTNGSIEKINGEYKALSSGYTQTNSERSYDKLAEVFADYTYSLPEVLTRDYVQTTFVPSTQELDNLPNFVSNLSEWNSGSEYVFAGNNTLYWTKAINDLGRSGFNNQNAVSANLMRLVLDYDQISRELTNFNRALVDNETWTRSWLEFTAQNFDPEQLLTTTTSANTNLKQLIDQLKTDPIILNSPSSDGATAFEAINNDYQRSLTLQASFTKQAITGYVDLLSFARNQLSADDINFENKALLINSLESISTSANELLKTATNNVDDLTFMLDTLKNQYERLISTLTDNNLSDVLSVVNEKFDQLTLSLELTNEQKNSLLNNLTNLQNHIYLFLVAYNEIKNPLSEYMKKASNKLFVLDDFENFESIRQADPNRLNYIGQTKITNNGYFKDRWLRKALNWELYDENRNPVIDTHIKIKDLKNNTIQDRARAMWIYSLRSQGIGDRTLTGVFRNEQLDSTLFWGFVESKYADKIKKLAFKPLNSESVVYIDLTTNNTNNLFYLKRQGDISTKHTLSDEGYVSWTSDYAILANYTNALVNINSEEKFELFFVDENNERVLDDQGRNLLTLGSRKYVAENTKSYNTAPIYAYQSDDPAEANKVLIKIQNQFKL
ncbi:PDxFFG protein [Ureaplasma sp. ES3154-GEN]|uniref:PDxFFG protein n=1 Tax=Ureaplasma sp. ES3154-GEN TaxID=2984844 RepID=UPI0021E6D93A|nr:PDxFFG protein [Ureaplasma sp. ES3154-GEN]MCV3743535.1 PDxFFG protein [Ureaplasma sp. ES3154-GEN]